MGSQNSTHPTAEEYPTTNASLSDLLKITDVSSTEDDNAMSTFTIHVYLGFLTLMMLLALLFILANRFGWVTAAVYKFGRKLITPSTPQLQTRGAW
ncbi:hypothetical protein QR680_000524 [Steinernema hermaphroditum]|uniref:Uncharacterized protein n=1 Tax=Steinernema hermaphroditum TaxID=289476 RepID=A0AA39LE75_9BILA|nr:hypothetical protein QR680_000524 [Steinernema hermaphroditum]